MDAPFVRLMNELLHILRRSKHRINLIIIGYIISIIFHRRFAYRIQIQKIRSQFLNVVQLLDNPS